MKKKWLWVLGLTALVIPIVVLTGCSCGRVDVGSLPSSLQVSLDGQQTGIWVNGEGKVTAVPDIATLRLGIEAQEATVAEAQAEAAEAMDEVMAALKDNSVAEKDIQTEYFSIDKVTRWNPETEQEIVLGYRVSNVVTAKVREVEETGSIIDAVARAGGDLTRIDDISFSVDDPSVYHGEARQEAMADAQAKAEQLAGLAGVRLGKPTYISESIYTPFPVYRGAAMEAVPEAPAPTPISPGEMEISLTIQVAYAILD